MALAESHGSLFAGGDLTEAGSRASFRIARWDLAPHAAPGVTPVAWEAVAPNPMAASGTRLEFSLAEAADVTLTIHDLAGREVARLIDGPLPPGLQVLHWSGLDRDGRKLHSGVYYARLAAAGKPPSVKALALIR
jgi:hypothetical protein